MNRPIAVSGVGTVDGGGRYLHLRLASPTSDLVLSPLESLDLARALVERATQLLPRPSEETKHHE